MPSLRFALPLPPFSVLPRELLAAHAFRVTSPVYCWTLLRVGWSLTRWRTAGTQLYGVVLALDDPLDSTSWRARLVRRAEPVFTVRALSSCGCACAKPLRIPASGPRRAWRLSADRCVCTCRGRRQLLFALEVFVNVCAVGARKYYRSGWNIADTLVVFAGALDTIPGACHRATHSPSPHTDARSAINLA